MKQNIKKKLFKIRKEYKKDIRPFLENNFLLQMMIRDTFLLNKLRNMECKTKTLIFEENNKELQNKYTNNILKKMPCGKYDSIMEKLELIDNNFAAKYLYKIPENIALGDAYEVVISIIRKKQTQKKDETLVLSKKEMNNIVETAFLFGVNTQLQKDGVICSSTLPNNVKDGVKYAQKFLVDKERDQECIVCNRYKTGSCKGTIDRKRDKITKYNCCGGYIPISNE